MRARLIALSILLTGCSTTSAPDAAVNGVSLIQNGQTFSMTAGPAAPQEISLKKAAFVIQAPALPDKVAIQVCATNDDAVLKKLNNDRSLDRNSCFKPGTGMALPFTQNPESGISFGVADGRRHNYYHKDRRVGGPASTRVYINDIGYVRTDVTDTAVFVVVIDLNNDNVAQPEEVWSARIRWQ